MTLTQDQSHVPDLAIQCVRDHPGGPWAVAVFAEPPERALHAASIALRVRSSESGRRCPYTRSTIAAFS
jgi:hypothetical protein